MELMEKRRKHFAALRAQEKRNRPPTKAQKRTQMSTYLKHMEKKAKGSKETAKGNRKKMLRRKRVGKQQQQESSKKQKMEEDKESDEVEEVSEDGEGELLKHLLIRPNGSSKRYSSMIRMLQGIDREDLEGDLKVMFEPDTTSDVWRMLQGYRVTIWKLIDSSGVHFIRNLKIQKLNIKFRGGLLRLEILQGYLRFLLHSTASTYFCLCSVSAAGYKDTTVADLQLLEDLLLYMDNTRAQQKALDDELVAPVDRLKIGKSNLRLSLILKSKEPTLKVALDALKLTPFYNAFEISADVPEIYMHEDMLKIFPKLPGHIFEEPPLEEEILSFIRYLGHTCEFKFLSDVNVNHMHQPWRSFAAIINKCLSGKTAALESLRLSRAQILWGMYHNKTVDCVYLLWEDLVYQVENKNSKKNNDMYYPRFTKVIIDYFMEKDQAIPRRNKMFWHYTRDDFMFPTIRVISKYQDTQVYGAILPHHLTNQAMLESKAYMTYHAYATGEKTPKPKSTKKKANSKSSPKMKLTQASKGKRIKTKSSEEEDDEEVNVSKDNDDDVDNDDEVDKDDEDDNADNQDDEILDDANQDDDDEQTNSDNDSDDFVHPKLSTHDDEARQDDEVNEEDSDEESDDESNEDNDEEVQGANVEEEEMDEEATHEEDKANKLYRDVTEDTHVIITALINPKGQQQSSSVSSGFVSNMLNPSPDIGIDIIFTSNTEATLVVDVLVTTIAEPPLLSATTLPPTPLITHLQQTPVPTPATVPSSSLQHLPNFVSLFGFDHRLKTLETDFSEFKQTNQFAEAVSSIPGIVDAYLANKMHEAVKTAIQLQSERLRDEDQAENADLLNKLNDNIKKIIKDQVKEQVKAQVLKNLPKIKKIVNEQLEAEVMTRSSTESKTSLAIAANLSELELKKILIDKMESNKSIYRSDEQKNLYKALVDAYECDKLILDTYGDIILFKRHRDDADKDEEPSDGSNRGDQQNFLLPIKEDLRESFNELIDTPLDFLAFMMNRLKVDTLTPELLTGLTFELMKGSCKSLVELEYLFEEVYKATTEQLDWNNPEGQQYPHDLRKPLPLIPNSRGHRIIPFDYFINNDLEYLSGGVSSRKYTTSVMKTKAADYGHIKWIEYLVPNRMESARDVYSKCIIIAVTKLEIVDWHNYKHLDWITVHKDDDKLYKFKEGNFNRLRIQDIEDMLLLLVQGKLINLIVEERLAFNVSLRMFTRSVVIQRRVEDLQLGVESYQKKLNLTKPDTYRPDLKRSEAYISYSNPRGFIYHNKDKKNRLMRIDELHKFSDGTLNDVRTAFNDRLKGIQMEYLPQISKDKVTKTKQEL
ncbi:retrovirus-related pol polyprotein from transposon TNT 1-94 [Tanacetum coccineum]